MTVTVDCDEAVDEFPRDAEPSPKPISKATTPMNTEDFHHGFLPGFAVGGIGPPIPAGC